MNQDPLDELTSFYDDCRIAPVPACLTVSAPVSLWLRLSIPLGGLTLGGLLALLLVALPTPTSPRAAEQAALALERAHYPLAFFGGSSEKGEGAGGEGSGMRTVRPRTIRGQVCPLSRALYARRPGPIFVAPKGVRMSEPRVGVPCADPGIGDLSHPDPEGGRNGCDRLKDMSYQCLLLSRAFHSDRVAVALATTPVPRVKTLGYSFRPASGSKDDVGKDRGCTHNFALPYPSGQI